MIKSGKMQVNNLDFEANYNFKDLIIIIFI